jgi:hypothetical protein
MAAFKSEVGGLAMVFPAPQLSEPPPFLLLSHFYRSRD